MFTKGSNCDTTESNAEWTMMRCQQGRHAAKQTQDAESCVPVKPTYVRSVNLPLAMFRKCTRAESNRLYSTITDGCTLLNIVKEIAKIIEDNREVEERTSDYDENMTFEKLTPFPNIA